MQTSLRRSLPIAAWFATSFALAPHDTRHAPHATPPAPHATHPPSLECWIRGNASDLQARPSPLDSTSVALDAGTVKVCYGRPSRRGREVLGQLLPYGTPWRLGANEATTIYVPFAARIAGTNVAPGWYSLYAIPDEKQWRVVVNSDVQRWGVPIDDEVRTKDAGAAVLPVEQLANPVEMLTITLRRRSNRTASMDVEWENARVRIPVEQR
ncbi:MAG: DUF2911 domain-containing protein [Gemmatimonadaceae bacterium]